MRATFGCASDWLDAERFVKALHEDPPWSRRSKSDCPAACPLVSGSPTSRARVGFVGAVVGRTILLEFPQLDWEAGTSAGTARWPDYGGTEMGIEVY